jgi:Mg-chelatase subunit ChlD
MEHITLNTQRTNQDNCISIRIDDKSITPETRLPISICLVIDTSGSMDASATDNTGEKSELSVLEVVIHTAITVAESLNENDELCVVSYSNSATINVPIQKMDAENKKKAITKIKALTASGMTNIYDGLYKAISIFEKDTTKNRIIYLLSDGDPNIEPPRGTVGQLKLDYSTMENPPTINTFGFGYSVKSEVLRDISNIAHGTYAFIPDGNLVGTVIINNLANTYCSYYTNAILNIELEPDTRLNFSAKYNSTVTDNVLTINLHTLKVGVDRNIIIESDKAFIGCTLHCREISTGNNLCVKGIDVADDQNFMKFQIFRTNTIALIETIMYLRESASRDAIAELATDIRDYLANNKHTVDGNIAKIGDLLLDIEGEITKAVEHDAFRKWGIKYLPSLQNAHLMEECNNFKDASVQHYGGQLFKDLQTRIEKIFIELPAPIPRAARQLHYGGGGGGGGGGLPIAHAIAVPVSMGRYYDNCGTCFHGDCPTLMEDGTTTKPVREIQKGDVLYGGGIVECVLRTKCTDGLMQYCCSPGGTLITKYHPIKMDTIVFPCDVFNNAAIYKSDYMFSFLMENGPDGSRQPFIRIGDIECITLAHNITDDPVATHPFYGGNIIVEQLKGCVGWNEGVVTFCASDDLFVRDDQNIVIGFSNKAITC